MKQLFPLGFVLLFCCLSGFSFSHSNRKKQGELVLHFRHFVGKTILKLDSVTYHNSIQQPFQITAFKYYVSNIRLVKTDGKAEVVPGYFLLNEEEPESRDLHLSNVPEGQYAGIEFLVGVDSVRNCSGIQKEALDPAKGMFWAWNTGYIFLKLDGISPFSTAPGHKLEYHIGGYRQPTYSLRTIRLETSGLQIQSRKTSSVEIKADVAALLSSPLPVDFTKTPMVVDADKAAGLADNILHLFSVSHIQSGL